jgi:biopolymer transport protein ExbD
MAGSGGNLESGEPEFQIAPMIDVLLVLLIFFMTVTSAQVLRVDQNIQLPIAPNAARKDNGRSEAVINVRWESDSRRAVFVFQERPHDNAADFVSELREVREASERQFSSGRNPSFRVVIRADRELPARFVAQAMGAAGEAGISDISFSTSNRE